MDKIISPYLKNYDSFVICRPNQKETTAPKGIDWNTLKVSYDEANLKLQDDYNVGLIAEKGNILCLDSDSIEFAEAIRQLLPPTYEEKTASGGYHFIFETTESIDNQVVKWNNKHMGEVRADRQYIVIAPSKAPSKVDGSIQSYEIINNLSPAYITKEDLQKVLSNFGEIKVKANNGKLDQEILKQIQSDEELSKLYNGDISKFPSRSEAEESLICKLVSRDFDKETIFKIMASSNLGKWNEKPISYRELTYNKAVSYVTNKKEGWNNGQNKAIENLELGAIELNTLTKQDCKTKWIIEGLAEEETIIMSFGQSNSFKSLITLGKAICLAKGSKFLGRYKVVPQKVLYISAENSRIRDIQRAKSIMKGLNLRKVPNLWVLPREKCEDVLTDSFKNKLSSFIEKHNITYVIIDTMNPVTPSIDDNKAQDVMKVFNNFLFPFIDKHKLTIEYLFHTDKRGKDFLGSTKWKGNSDNQFCFERDTERLSDFVTISNVKNRAGEQENIKLKVIGVKNNKGEFVKTVFTFLEQKGVGRRTAKKWSQSDKAKYQIKESLKKSKMDYSNLSKEVMKKQNVSLGTFKSALKDLKATDEVKQNDDIYYLEAQQHES